MASTIDIMKTPSADSSTFANPWEDLASNYAPKTIKSALELCEFLYINDTTYKRASERVVNYFLTEAKFSGQSGEEQTKFENLMSKDFDLMGSLQAVGYDHMCFQGDTKVVTKHGIFSIRDLTGKTVEVLSKGGVYRSADFKSFGVQRLLEVELSDKRTILATPEHQWIVKNCSNREVKIPTTELRKGHRIERTVAPRPEKNEDFYHGVRHGFVFGDGTQTSTNTTSAYFCGAKDLEITPYFEGVGNEIHEIRPQVSTSSGLPGNYKQLPENGKSDSYWYGFVCGFLAADGSVDIYGCSILTQKSKATLEKIAEQLPRIGMASGPVRGHNRSSSFINRDGSTRLYEGEMNYVTILKRFMVPDDFLISNHRKNFENNFKKTEYGKYIGIKSVRETGIVEEVFCCVEMETHTFVVENAILTGQCYGNSFSTISFPFVRSIACKECKTERNIKHVENFAYNLETGKINTFCPKCKVDKPHEINDYKKKDSKAIKMVRWNPKLITINANRTTHDMEYWTEIPQEIKSGVKAQDKFFLRTTPKGILDAARQDKTFKFNNSHIHHMREPFVAGLWLGGWGLPSILSSFKNFFRLQILRRYNEALMMDYIIPLRIISPKQGSYQEGNSIYNNLMREWRQQMQSAVTRHRQDGTDWNFFPFPVEYQAVGGEGRALAPVDLIENEEDRLLNGRGIPPELYRSTMSLQAAPIALRVFERTWSSLVRGFGLLAQNTTDSVSKYMASGDFDCEIESVKIIDDIENKAWRLQAMAARQLSKETAMGPMGISDVTEELKKILDEERKEQELTQEAQQEMQMAQMGLGNEQQGAQGAEGGGEGDVTPGNVNEQGDEIAKQLLTMDESTRRSQLLAISKQNDTLHAVVLKKMDVLRNQARSMGMQQALPQVINPEGQGQQGAPPPPQ